MRTAVIAVVLVAVGAVVQAHVTVSPRESQVGAVERYTVRVPTEGQVTTTSVELEVPADVMITEVVAGTGYAFETRKEGDRIVAITWKQDIKPGDAGQFVFVARNPRGQQIAWKARQRFADGTSADWIGVQGDRRPAAVTRLTARSNEPARSKGACRMKRIASIAIAVLFLASGARVAALHDGDHTGPDGEVFNVGKNGNVKISDDVVIGEVFVKKGRYVLQHRVDGDVHVLVLTGVPDKSGETRMHEIRMQLIPSPDMAKKSALFAVRLKDGSYRVAVVQIVGEGGDHIPVSVTTT